MNHQGHQEHQGATTFVESVAFGLLLVVVVARALALETLRDPFEITPGAEIVPRTLTAAASVWLDWLACFPAMLVLIARTIRPSPLAVSQSVVLLLSLALWAAFSPIWASDKFAAIVGVSHFIAGVAIFWAAMQLVRDWARLRIVAGLCFGLLLALVAYGLIYRFIELPDLQDSVQKNWPQILAQRGWEAGSFMEIQFRRKVMAGEMVGFNTSPNSFAAMVVMLLVVTIGALIQRLRDPGSRSWAIMIAIAVPLTAIVLWFTQSRAALITPMIALACFGALTLAADFFALRRKTIFIAMIALVAVGAAAVVMYGFVHGQLIHDSLTFRWRYWIGSMRVFLAHPILGVGWNNFGDPYLAVREAIASEEIKDPHNLFVRFATELGAIGLLLSIGWLTTMWWEMSRPASPQQPRARRLRSSALKMLVWIAGVGMALNIVMSVDLGQDIAWVFIESIKRLLYLALILIGLIVVAFRSFDRQEIDDRPAPWLRRGILIALAVFLLHNLIDFSFFETGPMWIFMLLAGASIGLASDAASAKKHRGIGIVTAFVALLWILAGLVIALPITVAESKAHTADEFLRLKQPGSAAREFLTASDSLPFSNSDYLYRAARALAFDGAPVDEIRRAIGQAIAANPRSPAYYAFLARMEAGQPQPDMPRVIAAFDKFLSMDPSDVQSRLLFAQSLQRAGMNREAIVQYQLALEKNSQLDPNEPKRLSPERIAEIDATIARLK